MPSELQKAYLDGASMAYKDVSDKLYQMIEDAPESVRGIMSAMEPFAKSCRMKAAEVYLEADRMENGVRQ